MTLTLAFDSAPQIYHLENHYSLIYGARWWVAEAGYGGRRTVRQVLVAKPGQKPCYWVDFAWLRSNALAWKGYCVVGISRLDRPRVLRDEDAAGAHRE